MMIFSRSIIIVLAIFLFSGCAHKVDEEKLFGHMQKGLALSDQGDKKGALNQFQAARDLAPDLWDAHYELGRTLAAQKRWPEAVLELRLAIDLNPEYAPAYRELGKVLKETGFYKAAVVNYTLALDKTPSGDLSIHHSMMLKEKAELLRFLNDCGEALIYYERALTIIPSYARAMIERGWCLKETGLNEIGEVSIRKGLDVSPKVVIALAGDGEMALLKEAVSNGGDVNIEDNRKKRITPLMAAVRNRHYDIAAWLLKRGADPNTADQCGSTALHMAVRDGNLEMASLLEKFGAKADNRDCLGTLPRDLLLDGNPVRGN